MLLNPIFETPPRNNIKDRIEVVISNPNNEDETEIWYTTDGSDPMDLATHTPSSTYQIYTNPILLTEYTIRNKLKIQVVPMKH